jgi:predicted TIM-barrel fold metal-dependent hydrolase
LKRFSGRVRASGILKILFFMSYVGLVVWAVPSARQFLRYQVFSLFGGAPGVFHANPEDLPLSLFQPESLLVLESHMPERPRFETIEFHGHIGSGPFAEMPEDLPQRMQAFHIRTFVNLSLFTTTHKAYVELKNRSGNNPNVLHFVGLNWGHLKQTDFGQAMAQDLEQIAREGAKGVKLWKNFGLKEKTPDGKLLAMDDPRLDPVWDVCAKYKLLVAIHTADPPAFFRPVDGKNERFDELARRPEWSFNSPELPTFPEILAQRNRLFERRPDVRFVALHFGELAHDLKQADQLLVRHPNVTVDIAQRIDELGRQPRAARAFILKHQDRILFGTDNTDGLKDLEKVRIYWRFLETADEYFDYHSAGKSRKGLWKIYGLELPDNVLEKIYYGNAARLLGI